MDRTIIPILLSTNAAYTNLIRSIVNTIVALRVLSNVAFSGIYYNYNNYKIIIINDITKY